MTQKRGEKACERYCYSINPRGRAGRGDCYERKSSASKDWATMQAYAVNERREMHTGARSCHEELGAPGIGDTHCTIIQSLNLPQGEQRRERTAGEEKTH